MSLRITLAGRVEVEAAGRPVPARGLGPLGRLALAYLVLERDRPVPRHELADVLWGDTLPRSWETSVRVVISKVRAVLADAGLSPGEVLTTVDGCYQVHLPAGSVVDLDEAAACLESALTSLEAGAPAAATTAAATTAAVAARQLLPGASGAWVERRQAELRELRLRALEVLSDAATASGDPDRAVAAAEEAVALEPLRESAHLRVLVAHASAGNRAEALRAYERVRRVLAEELGVSPADPLEEAYLGLLGTEPPPETGPEPPAGAGMGAGARPGRAPLPRPPTTFVGRDGAVAEVRRLLGPRHLVSLVGTGGVGKTRLGLEVASAEAASGRPVALVELGPLSDPGLVPQQVLSSLGLGEQPGRSPTDTVVDHLCAGSSLVVLDNCEHVLEAAAALADSLLRACDGVRLLATTREPLRVPGETAWRVPSLDVPAAGDPLTLEEVVASPAGRLFVDRALATRPDLALDDDDAAALAQLVRRLDGIPLALELAAGRVTMLSVGELAERLDDRFRLLAGGSRTAPSRHQTLRAAVDWSYDALPPDEAALFRRLAVFAGSFPLDGAEIVCAADARAGDVFGPLSGLVDKSLVMSEQGRGATRYRLSETMRRYAEERLAEHPAEDAAHRGAHLAWISALVAQAEPELRGPDQARWLHILDDDLDEVRSALGWGLERRDPRALALAAGLERFWELRGYFSEGRRWLEALLATTGPEVPGPARAKALRAAAILAQRQGDYEPARALHSESLTLARAAGDERGVAAAVHGLGNLAALQGELAAARRLYEEALAIGRRLDDDHVVAAALTNLGTVAQNQASFDEARAFGEESLAVRRRMGDRHGIAMVVGNLAWLSLQQGDHGRARALYEQSLALQRELGDRPGIVNSLCNLGYLALTEADLVAATALLEESLELAGELGDKYGTALSLLRLAKVARAEGDLARAAGLDDRALTLASELGAKRALAEWLEGSARTAVAQGAAHLAMVLLGAAEAAREELGAPLPPAERPGREADLAAARSALGEAGVAAAWEEGRAMALEKAVRLAADG